MLSFCHVGQGRMGCPKMRVYGTVTYWAVRSLWLSRSLEIRTSFQGEQDVFP